MCAEDNNKCHEHSTLYCVVYLTLHDTEKYRLILMGAWSNAIILYWIMIHWMDGPWERFFRLNKTLKISNEPDEHSGFVINIEKASHIQKKKITSVGSFGVYSSIKNTTRTQWTPSVWCQCLMIFRWHFIAELDFVHPRHSLIQYGEQLGSQLLCEVQLHLDKRICPLFYVALLCTCRHHNITACLGACMWKQKHAKARSR